MVSCCDLEIVLDTRATDGVFSNYDTVEGVVVLNVHTSTAFSNVQVTIEGTSRTTMEIPRDPRVTKDKVRETEKHTLLYSATTLLPSPEQQLHKTKTIVLDPGKYRLPFRFKIPLNNRCTGHASFEDSGRATGHRRTVSGTVHSVHKLPPSFSGMGQAATIRYYVKATAVRVSNHRSTAATAYEPFIFLPIDESNILMADEKQSYARREFAFKNKYPELVGIYEEPQTTTKTTTPPLPAAAPSSQSPTQSIDRRRRSSASRSMSGSSNFFKNFFGTTQRQSSITTSPQPVSATSSRSPSMSRSNTDQSLSSYTSNMMPTAVQVDPVTLRLMFEMRLRFPAFVLPAKPPNFQFYVLTKSTPDRFQLMNGVSSGLGTIFLRYLKIELIATTDYYVSSYRQRKTQRKTLFEDDTLFEQLDVAYAKESKPYKAVGQRMYELQIPTKLYKKAIVPEDTPPTFKTCNVERRYQLEVNAGFADRENAIQGQLVTLTSDVQVMSGMEPVIKDPEVGAYASRTELFKATLRSKRRPPPLSENIENSVGTVPLSDGLPTYEEVMGRPNGRRRRTTFTQDQMYYVDFE